VSVTRQQVRAVEPLSDRDITEPPRVSVVIPCLNEAENIEECVARAFAVLGEHRISGEVIVADNGSDDGSGALAAAVGARVVFEPRRGYGNAYLAGFAAASGEYIVMADADLTYDFEDIPRFVKELEGGAELVMGNRMDNIQPGAMPWHHRYLGNPALTGMLNLFFRTGVKDAHCGMRALRKDALPVLDLRATGMEFASEMVIRAAKEDLDIRQFPIEYRVRRGQSKLSSWRDGWRHLRFLLVHSPTHLFAIPGILMTSLGALVLTTVITDIGIFGRSWQLHSMVAGAMMTIVGIQVLALGLCAHAYGVYFMGEKDPWFNRMRARFRLEHGLVVGGACLLSGVILGSVILARWISEGLGRLEEERLALLGATLVIVGIQIFFTSFLLSILGLRRRAAPAQPEIRAYELTGDGPSPRESPQVARARS
jgi:hypothetical protein